MAGRRIVVAAAGLAGGVVPDAAALTVSGMLGGFVAAPAMAQVPPPGTEGSAPGLAVYWFSASGIKGRWAATDATAIATEDWTRQ